MRKVAVSLAMRLKMTTKTRGLAARAARTTPPHPPLTDGPVSTLGTPMALFSGQTLRMGYSS